MMRKFRESFWESDRSLRKFYEYTVKRKKIPFTDPLRIRVDLLEHEGLMQLFWAHLGFEKRTTVGRLIESDNFAAELPEIQAYRQRKYLELIEGRPLWGLDIGVRYVSIDCPPSPSSVDKRILKLCVSTHRKMVVTTEKGTFNYQNILQMLLMGGPDKFLESSDLVYRFWLHESDEDGGLGWFARSDQPDDVLKEYWG